MRKWTREERNTLRSLKRHQSGDLSAWHEIYSARHACQRAWERYRINLKPRDVYLIASRIAEGDSTLIRKKDAAEIHQVTVLDRQLFAVFFPDRAIVTTFLAPDMLKARELRRARRALVYFQRREVHRARHAGGAA